MNELTFLAEIELTILINHLKTFRMMRDKHALGSEIRQAYNSVCDRLDVLCSKVSEEHRISTETKLRGNLNNKS